MSQKQRYQNILMHIILTFLIVAMLGTVYAEDVTYGSSYVAPEPTPTKMATIFHNPFKTTSMNSAAEPTPTQTTEPTSSIPPPPMSAPRAITTTPVTVIEPSPASGPGYRWSGSAVQITSPGEYAFSTAKFPDTFSVEVKSAGVTLDGKGVTLSGIDGHKTLNLKNINVDFFNTFDRVAPAITVCNNIENSSIVASSNSKYTIFGIGELHGNIDDTTTITVTNQQGEASGFREVYGTISGGTFTLRSQRSANGVRTVSDGGMISGGTFAVTSKEHASGISYVYGMISGGTFTVTGQQSSATGVYYLFADSMISGGTFTATSQQDRAYGVREVGDGATISGGKFTVTSPQGQAYGVYQVVDDGTVSGGEFTVNGKKQVI